MKFFETKYRIVTDSYAGYEAQYRHWWMPFWLQCFFTNTSGTIEGAKRIAKLHKSGEVVEYLDL